MRNVNSRPTLLVFTRGAERETRRRRLLPARWAPVELAFHHRCLEATLAAGREAGCALAVSQPVHRAPVTDRRDVRRLPQSGRAFGERLRAAVRHAGDESAGPLLVVGTDTPGLAAGHLRAAIERLEREPSSVVLGPAPDGGIYLLATCRPLDEVLAGVAWRRRDTADSLRAALAEAGIRVTLLEPLADLDRPQDLARWVSLVWRDLAGGWSALIARVREALAALSRLAAPAALGRPRDLATALPGGRAPPSRL